MIVLNGFCCLTLLDLVLLLARSSHDAVKFAVVMELVADVEFVADVELVAVLEFEFVKPVAIAVMDDSFGTYSVGPPVGVVVEAVVVVAAVVVQVDYPNLDLTSVV